MRGRAHLLVLCLLLTACTGVPTVQRTPVSVPTVPEPTPAAERRGGTFTEPSVGDAVTMQPLVAADAVSIDRISLMFESLRTRDPQTLEFRPGLAAAWEFAPDSQSVTYTLRENLAWSDGHPLTADDIRFTWDALLDPDVRFPARGLLAGIAGVEAPDSRRITFHFRQVGATAFLWTDIIPPLPRHVFEGQDLNAGPLNRENTVGSGAFVLAEWQPDEHATFVANPRHWKGPPRLDRYVFRIVPDGAAAYHALLAGEVDTAPVPPHAREEASRADGVYLLAYYSYAAPWDYLGFNLRNPPFDDPRVRRAFAHAIDRRSIIEEVLSGHAREQHSIYPAGSPVYSEEVPRFEHDPDQARTLLRESGWAPGPDGVLEREGQPLRVRLHFNTDNRRRAQVAERLAGQLGAIGVRVEVSGEEATALLGRLRERLDFDLFLLGWAGGLDPDGARPIWTTGGSQNYGGYSNPEVDRRFVEAGRLLDLERERRPLYAEIQRTIAEDQPYVFLWTLETLRGFNKRIAGPRPVHLGTVETRWNVHEWHLTGER
jgi:peptide/nickel transport system substrate-binding protein